MVQLIRISPQTHPIYLQLAYAKAHNFTQISHYRDDLDYTYLHPLALIQFEKAMKNAAKLNLTFHIWDAFRPIEVQQSLWQAMPDERYVSHPETGLIPHCRGIALDLTLMDKKHDLLDMGADFDEFSEISHVDCLNMSVAAYQNRLTLIGLMCSVGFICNETEWWHFQLPDSQHYPVIHTDDFIRPMLKEGSYS
ncbi:MAG: M15 family metallopeptidase [Endozoicomonadaceae bacterium]|nr:M15 family metallopeptidase [Endozoicomonadaceae bacterium]